MTTTPAAPDTGNRRVLLAIVVILVAYAAAVLAGIPQQATAAHGESAAHETSAEGAAEGDSPIFGVSNGDAERKSGQSPTRSATAHPPYAMVLPFAILLSVIAVFPLVPGVSHWWDSNPHRFYVAGLLAAITLTYYLFWHSSPLKAEWPAPHLAMPSEGGPSFNLAWDVLANAMLIEYLPFIMLLFALFTITGGIRVEGDLPAHSATNATFLAIGAVLASLIGTTGAAMLLIRPLLETNRERKHVKHTVVFFIFIICNCGGLLLPTGDPPLFLGYLLGVGFFWTLRLWPEWLFVNAALVAIYYIYDRFWCYPHEQKEDIARDETAIRPMQFSGIWPNVLLLAAVIVSVAMLDPGSVFPGTDWHPWIYLREIVLLGLVGLSLWLGSSEVRRANGFSFAPILEVAALFFGIFISMQPPLQILSIKGPDLGLSTPTHFFWASGSLSSLLDNAPTYVVFFETARTLTPGMPRVPSDALLAALSLGAVFMGANTYIGNGPNFMVKAIAEQSGVRMPSFFGYMVYSMLILVPLFVLTNLLFLR